MTDEQDVCYTIDAFFENKGKLSFRKYATKSENFIFRGRYASETNLMLNVGIPSPIVRGNYRKLTSEDIWASGFEAFLSLYPELLTSDDIKEMKQRTENKVYAITTVCECSIRVKLYSSTIALLDTLFRAALREAARNVNRDLSNDFCVTWDLNSPHAGNERRGVITETEFISFLNEDGEMGEIPRSYADNCIAVCVCVNTEETTDGTIKKERLVAKKVKEEFFKSVNWLRKEPMDMWWGFDEFEEYRK